jgi:hypothetical protein
VLFRSLRNRPNRPFQPNDSARFQEKSFVDDSDHAGFGRFVTLVNIIGETGHNTQRGSVKSRCRAMRMACSSYLPQVTESIGSS